MKKMFFTIIALNFISVINAGNPCNERMFDAMDWAAEAGLDDQAIADAGNYAYAECWLMYNNLKGGKG